MDASAGDDGVEEDDCCLRFLYSVMESLRFGVANTPPAPPAPPAPPSAAAVGGVDDATSAGLSRGSELAVLVKIFGYVPRVAAPVGPPTPGDVTLSPPMPGAGTPVILAPVAVPTVPPRVDNDSVTLPARSSEDFAPAPTAPPPPIGVVVREPSVEKLVGRICVNSDVLSNRFDTSERY